MNVKKNDIFSAELAPENTSYRFFCPSVWTVSGWTQEAASREVLCRQRTRS